FVAGSNRFGIRYDAGTGNNDVVLYGLPAAAPSLLYVNDQWSSLTSFMPVDGDLEQTGTQTAYVGYDAFGSIEDALDAYSSYAGPIVVNGGSYGSALLAGGGNVSLRLVQDLSDSELNVTFQEVSGDAGDGIVTRYYNAANANLTIEQGIFAGVISGPGTLTKTTAGTLTLSGANTFTGNVAVNGGTAKMGHTTAFGDRSTAVTKVVVASGAAVDFNGRIDATYGYTIAGTGVGGTGALTNTGGAIGTGNAQCSNIKLSADATIGGTGNWALLTWGYAATTLDLAGHTLTKVGTNTFTLVNSTLTAGAIRIAGGTFTQNANNKPGGHDASAIAFTLDNIAGATLNLNNLNLSVGSLAGGGATGGGVSLGSGTLTVGALSTPTTYAGIISGGGGLTKTGTGTLTLTGASNFTGTVTASGGVLRIGNRNAFGAANTAFGKVVIASGGTVDLNGVWDATYGYTIAGTGATGSGALINNGAEITYGRAQSTNIKLSADAMIGGTGNFALLASGYGPTTLDLAGFTLTKSGSNTFTIANATLTAGTIHIAEGTFTQYRRAHDASAVAFTLANTAGATLALGSPAGVYDLAVGSLAGGGTTGGNVSLSGNRLTVGALGTSTTYAGVISGTGGLTKTGAGTQTLSGASTFTGSVAVNGGTIKIGHMYALGARDAAVTKVVVASGAAVDFNGVIDAGYGYTIAGAGVGGTGALTNSGGNIGNGTLQCSNITLSANATIGGTGNWALLAPGYAATTLDLAGFTLTKTGSNTFTVANTTFTAGTINIAGGTFSQYTRAHDVSAVVFSLDDTAGATLNLGGYHLSVGSLAGGGATGGNVNLGGNRLTVGALGTSTTYAGAISGGGALTKTGSGRLTLTGTSSYSGGTAVDVGQVNIQNGAAVGTGAVTVVGGATLELQNNITVTGVPVTVTSSGTWATLRNVSGDNTWTGPVTMADQSYVTVEAGSTLTCTGLVVSGGYVIKLGTGALVLSGTSTTDHHVDVTAGVVSVRSDAAAIGSYFHVTSPAAVVELEGGVNIPSDKRIYLSYPATSDDPTFRSVSGNNTWNGIVTLHAGGGSHNIGVDAGSTLTLAGPVDQSAAGNLVKVGDGVLVLNGPNTYTGTTAVKAGMLLVNSSLPDGAADPDVTVLSGATLGGIGAINGQVLVESGGHLAPGTSPG
ncbi:MAG TPA: autotransporter-associated beta strand repeat-containing protein, partial [Candidatus Anammoximicrobium sp.]|nr:autotransporter-associated beta strand repeat-containing protein [Candidatus Anammoximicrobium sp.]